jgi:hypothetical protein
LNETWNVYPRLAVDSVPVNLREIFDRQGPECFVDSETQSQLGYVRSDALFAQSIQASFLASLPVAGGFIGPGVRVKW